MAIDLTTNPLEDAPELEQPKENSILDTMTSVIVDQIREAAEKRKARPTDPDPTPTTGAMLPKKPAKKTASKIPTHISGIFDGNCPDFNTTIPKQALLENQWDLSRFHWQSSYAHELKNTTEAIFNVAVLVIRELGIDDIVNIVTVKDKYSELIQFISTGKQDSITRVTTNAKNHRFGCKWDLTPTATNFYIDDESRVIQEMARAINAELYEYVRRHLLSTDFAVEVDYISDKSVGLEMYKQCIGIQDRSGRGAGNIAIIASDVAASMVREGTLVVKDVPEKRYHHLQLLGEIGQLTVFVDSTLTQGRVIINYKKKDTTTEPGVYFLPRTVIHPGGAAIDPSTFQNYVSLTAEYGMLDPHRYNGDGDVTPALEDYVTNLSILDIPYTVEDDRMLTELFVTRPIHSSLIAAGQVYAPAIPINRGAY